MAAAQLAFGPATVTLFGVVIPVFPALAGMLSVYLARLIAPKDKRVLTGVQTHALLGLLMLAEVALIVQYNFTTPKATLAGMVLGWMGMLVPEKAASVFWEWFKSQLRGWLSVPTPPPVPKYTPMEQAERTKHMKAIFKRIWPTERVPDDEQELIDRLKEIE